MPGRVTDLTPRRAAPHATLPQHFCHAHHACGMFTAITWCRHALPKPCYFLFIIVAVRLQCANICCQRIRHISSSFPVRSRPSRPHVSCRLNVYATYLSFVMKNSFQFISDYYAAPKACSPARSRTLSFPLG